MRNNKRGETQSHLRPTRRQRYTVVRYRGQSASRCVYRLGAVLTAVYPDKFRVMTTQELHRGWGAVLSLPCRYILLEAKSPPLFIFRSPPMSIFRVDCFGCGCHCATTYCTYLATPVNLVPNKVAFSLMETSDILITSATYSYCAHCFGMSPRYIGNGLETTPTLIADGPVTQERGERREESPGRLLESEAPRGIRNTAAVASSACIITGDHT